MYEHHVAPKPTATDESRCEAQDSESGSSNGAAPQKLHSASDGQGSKLTYFDAFALLISIEIGSGIFASTSQVNRNAAAPGFAILLWLICGLLAWCGATCFAELGVSLPVNGGMQEYLRYIFGDGLAFTTAWIWIMAVKPCSIAIQSITFAQYSVNAIVPGAVDQSGWQIKLVAIMGFYFVVVFNMISIKASTGMMKFFTVLKIAAMVLLFVLTILNIGFGVHAGDMVPSRDWYERDWFGVSNPNWKFGIWNTLGQSTVGIYAGLWAFSGIDSANMVAGDIQNPSRNLPLALNTALPTVIVCYVLANICYYLVVPWSDIDTTNTIAVTVGNTVCGWYGGVAFAILVSLACLGGANVNVFTTSRQVVSAAQANWLPRALEKYSSVPAFGRRSLSEHLETQPLLASNPEPPEAAATRTPIRAISFSAVITTVFIVLGTFSSLVTFIELCEYTFFSITTVGILVLRYREPQLSRPYRPYIIIPIIFSIMGFCLVVVGCTQAPIQAGVLFALILAGYLKQCGTDTLRRRRKGKGQQVQCRD